MHAHVAASLLALSLAPDSPAPVVASGTFEDKALKMEVGGAYAFRGKTFASEGSEGILLAVSNTEFVTEAVDEHFDRRYAIDTLFADDESRVVFFEFDETGKYRGMSYYFGPGAGCGFCYDGRVKSTVRVSGGRLKGDLSHKDEDRQFRITVDVPLPPKVWGDPLPAGGGDPAKSFLAYHAALEKRDKKAVYDLLDADRKGTYKEFEAEGKLDGWLDYQWSDVHTSLSQIKITGGFVRGDRAVVLFDGKNPYIETLHGEALLRKEGGRWLMHRDLVKVGGR